jgi:hypothetical protein
MNDQASRGPATAAADHLQLRKLELEIAEAELRQRLLEHKEKLGIEKLQQEILGSRIQNDTKQRMAELEAEKMALELREKKTATKYALPPAVWDLLKYAVAVIPVVVTVVTLYLTHQKDTRSFRHQLELEQRFKVDNQVVDLLKKLGDDKNPLEVMHAALALQSYGKAATRLLVPHLRVNHPNWLVPFFVESLIDVVANEPDATKQSQAADELVERIIDQAGLTITEFTQVPTESTRQAFVRAHLEALVQLWNRCKSACEILRAALKKRRADITKLITRLEADPQYLVADLREPIAQTKQMLSAMPKV